MPHSWPCWLKLQLDFLQNRQNSPDGSWRSCIAWAAWGKGSVGGSSGQGIQLFFLCREGQMLTLGPAIGPHGALELSAWWQELELLRLLAPTPCKRAPPLMSDSTIIDCLPLQSAFKFWKNGLLWCASLLIFKGFSSFARKQYLVQQKWTPVF